MARTRIKSGLPVDLVDAFWTEVEGLLRSEHGMTGEQAVRTILRYRNEIDADKVGDILYHQSAVDVAHGLITGGYAQA
jgi:hypothetical protein